MSFPARAGGVMLQRAPSPEVGMHSYPRVAFLVLALVLASVSYAAAPDWSELADLETVEVISTDEDGGSRLTTIWIVVRDHQAYVRTGGTIWGDNVEREGRLRLRLPEGEYPLRAEKVLSASEIESVEAAFAEKYGSSDWWSGLVRFGETRIFRLLE
jgi:hypothetical protein